MEASRRTGWVRTQTPDSGALVPTTGAAQERQGAAGLVMTFVQTRSAHWYIGPAATLPAPARQPSDPQSWSAPAITLHQSLHSQQLSFTTGPFYGSQCNARLPVYTLLSHHRQVHFAVFTWSASVLARQDSTEWTDCPGTN